MARRPTSLPPLTPQGCYVTGTELRAAYDTVCRQMAQDREHARAQHRQRNPMLAAQYRRRALRLQAAAGVLMGCLTGEL